MHEPSSDSLTTLPLQTLDNAQALSLSAFSGTLIPTAHATSEFTMTSAGSRKRLTPREELQTLRQEISVLSNQLQQQEDNRQLQESLDRLLSENTASAIIWKRIATRELHAQEISEDTKAELLRRISINRSFLENVKRKLLAQAQEIADRQFTPQSMRVGLDAEDGPLYMALKAGLDYRCSHLDDILQQCVCATDTPEKHDCFLQADGRGMEVRKISVQPFDMATISSTAHRYMQEHADVCWHQDNDVYAKRLLELGEFSADKKPLNVLSRSVMRRFVYQNQMIMLWETVARWNTAQCPANTSRTTWLWQKSWVVLRPLEDGLSLSQKRISIQLQASDRSVALVLSPHVMAVLEPLRAFGKRQVQNIENMLLDMAMQRISQR